MAYVHSLSFVNTPVKLLFWWERTPDGRYWYKGADGNLYWFDRWIDVDRPILPSSTPAPWINAPFLPETAIPLPPRNHPTPIWSPIFDEPAQPVSKIPKGPAQPAPKYPPPPPQSLSIESVLGFKFDYSSRRTYSAPPPPPGNPPKFSWIAGVKCPPINGLFCFYSRLPFEEYSVWHKRVKSLATAVKLGRRLAKHSQNLELEPLEQLIKLTTRWNFNSFELLGERLLDDSVHLFFSSPIRKQKQGKKFFGPRTCPLGWAFEQERLARKLQLASLSTLWKEKRSERRIRLRKVVSFEDHRVFFLRASMEKLLTEHLQEQYRADPVGFVSSLEAPVGQMMDPQQGSSQGEEKTITEQKSNVILEQAEGVSKTEPVPPSTSAGPLRCLATGPPTKSISSLVDRFITIKQGTWTHHLQDDELFSLTLPRDAIDNPNFQNSPNYSMFQIHTYWRGTMKIKILVNANARQYGQLQVKAYYGTIYDENYANRDHIWTNSQMPHVLITAPSSNSGELTIPFDFINPVMKISRASGSWQNKKTSEDDEFANLVTLSCRVLIPLTVAETTVKRVDYSIAIAFEDNVFSGMIDKRLVEYKPAGEMFSLASMFALKEVAERLDPNRDNPTVSAVGAPVYPINCGSWCLGNGLAEWSQVLRLNPASSATYPSDRMVPVDEMKINYIKSIFGLFAIRHWSAQETAGHLLFKMDASPLFNASDYPQVAVGKSTAYCIPPVGVLSAFNCFWTGTLELRIDIVGATELTGRILVTYVPRYYGDLTIEQAFNCMHSIFSLQSSNRQFVFQIPYLADKMYWDRRRLIAGPNYESYQPPGTVYVFVYNELVSNATIPSDCYLNFYIRGGDDFEVAVPAFPNLALSFTPEVIVPDRSDRVVVSLPGYNPVYAGAWRNYTRVLTHYPIFRYGEVTDHIAQFDFTGNVAYTLNTYLKFLKPTTTYDFKWKFSISYNDPRSKVTTTKNFDSYTRATGMITFLTPGNYCYAIPVSEHMAKYFIGKIPKAPRKVSLQEMVTFFSDGMEKWGADIARRPWNLDLSLKLGIIKQCQDLGIAESEVLQVRMLDNTTSAAAFVTSSDSGGRVVAQYKELTPISESNITGDIGGVDERKSIVATPSCPAPTCGLRQTGKLVFGEKFDDLKDYCRRYQVYAEGTFPLPEKTSSSKFVMLKFPVNYNGLPLVVRAGSTVDQISNRVREGVIPLIASGYRYAYGGIRMRLYIEVDAAFGSTTSALIAVQHRPDIIPESNSVVVETVERIGMDDLILPGYATYYQGDAINNVICIEIPPYVPVAKLFLQVPSQKYLAKRWSNLGQLVVGINNFTNGTPNVNYKIFYSLADDARFSNFIGFCPMIDITQITEGPFEVNQKFKETDDDDFEHIENPVPFYENPKGDMKMPSFNFNPFSKAEAAIENVAAIDVSEINSTISDTRNFLGQMKNLVKDSIPVMADVRSKFEKYLSVIIAAVSHLIQCILNLSVASVATALISILAQIKLVTCDFILNLAEGLQNIFNLREALNEQTESASGNPSGQMALPDDFEEKEKNYRCAYISTLIAAVAAALALTPNLIGSSWKSFGCILFDGIRKFSMTANTLFTFFKNNLLLIQRIGNDLVNNSPKIKDVKFLELEQKDIYDWCVEAITICDPRMEHRLFSNVKMASRIHALAMKGNVLMLNLSKIHLEPNQYNTIKSLKDTVEKLRARLTKMHLAPPVRFEPFVMELTGKTGCGKSTLMLQDVGPDLFKHVGLRHEGELIYQRQIGNPHWNGCQNQPIFYVDEKFPIAKQGFDDVQLSELFLIKSRVILNPLMADLPDKNLRYNPVMALYCSNNPFPKLTGIMDEEAVNRRRDVLVEMRFNPRIHNKYSRDGKRRVTMRMLTAAERYGWNCSQFRFHTDPIDQYATWGPWMNYTEFKSSLCKKWMAYYVEEEKNFQRAMHLALSCYPDENEEFKTIDQKWIDMLDNKFGTRAELDLKKLINDMYNLEKYKEFKDAEREISLIQRVRSAFGQPTTTDIDLELALKKLRADATNQLNESINAIEGPIGNAGNSPPAEPSNSSGENRNLIFLDMVKNKTVICPHQILDLIVAMSQDVSYDPENKSWIIGKDFAESVFQFELLADPKLTLNVQNVLGCKQPIISINNLSDLKTPSSTINNCFLHSDFIYIGETPCTSEICVWRDKSNRIQFCKEVLKTNTIAKRLLQECNFKNFRAYFPDEFMDHLSDEISEDKAEAAVTWRSKFLEKIEFVKNWFEIIKEKLMSINWKKWFQRLAILIGVFFFVGGLLKLWTLGKDAAAEGVEAAGLAMSATAASMLAEKPKILAIEPNAFASGDFRVGSKNKTPSRNIVEKTFVQPGGQLNVPRFENVRKGICRNSFFLSLYGPNGKDPIVGRCLGICGNYALVVDHYWEAWTNASRLWKTDDLHYFAVSNKVQQPVTLKFSDLEYIKISNSALGLIKLKDKSKIKPFKDIRNLIAKREQHKNTNGMGAIFEYDVDKNAERELRVHSCEYVLRSSIKVDGTDFFKDYRTGSVYEYFGFSGPGKCGSILINSDCLAPILGMHTAGTTRVGYSEAIYQEMFDSLANVICADGSLGHDRDSKWYIEGETIGIGGVASKFAHRANEKSVIIPSFVQINNNGEFPIFTAPSVLSPKDSRLVLPFSPMLEGCKYHGKPLLPFNSEDLKIAVADIKNLILAKCKPVRGNVGLLTKDQAIGGIPGMDAYLHLEWNSSEGFPFVGMRPPGAHDKRWLFNMDNEGHYESTNPLLERVLEQKWEMRLRNVIPDTVFTDCLKDCTVAKEKVLIPGKTRIFSMSPVDFTIQQRQCTLDFVAAYMHNRLELEHAVGINPDSSEWADLATKLLEPGDKIATGDYSKFGDTIPPEIIHAFFEIIQSWYRRYGTLSHEHEQQLKIMPYELANCLHLMFDFLYLTVCGQPSGNSLTVLINSFANSCYIRCAWLQIMRSTRLNSLSDFHTHVKIYSYGDDIIISLSEEVCEIFNAQTLCDFFATVNLKFTNADKSDEIIAYTNLSKADFLKRGFIPHPTRKFPLMMLAPLSVESIEDTVNWITKESNGRNDPNCQYFKGMSLQVCEDALRNAFGKGEQYYSLFKSKLENFWLKHNVHFVAPTWEQWDVRIFDLKENINEYAKFNFFKL